MKNDNGFWILAFGFSILMTILTGGAAWWLIPLAALMRLALQPAYNTVERAERQIGYSEPAGCALAGGCVTMLMIFLVVCVAMIAVMGEQEAGGLIRELTKGLEQP